LWETALRFARRETDTKSERVHNRSKRGTSIQARVTYAEHCARRVALSKANQAITSDLIPNSDPLNIDHLRPNHPEPAHPERDPVRVSSILWPRPHGNYKTTGPPMRVQSFLTSGSVSLKYISTFAHAHL